MMGRAVGAGYHGGHGSWGDAPGWDKCGLLALSEPGMLHHVPDPNLDLPRLEAYVTKLSAAADDFFRFLPDASRP